MWHTEKYVTGNQVVKHAVNLEDAFFISWWLYWSETRTADFQLRFIVHGWEN
jgi:hypothetical protein